MNMKKIILALAVLLLVSITSIAVADCEHSWEWKWDSKAHWQECVLCGEKTESEEHTLSLSVLEVKGTLISGWLRCKICGVYEEGEWKSNDEEHWLLFPALEQRTEPSPHEYIIWNWDDNTHWKECACGAKTTSESHQIEWKTDADTHWQECTICGAKTNRLNHWAYCDAPDICAKCGKSAADGIVIDAVYHEWDDYSYNETEHWNHCERCGNDYDVDVHWANCDAPDICVACGKSVSDGIVIGEVYHYSDDCTPYNEIYHQFECEHGYGLVLTKHVFVDGVCVWCGYAEPIAAPTAEPTVAPTVEPTVAPTVEPTVAPTVEPTAAPTAKPTVAPTAKPTEKPDDGTEWRYLQNVSSLGIRFRDIKPGATNEWLMFMPLDLSRDDVQEIDLIAANISYVGKVTVTVSGGNVKVEDHIKWPVEKLNLQFTLLPDLASVTSADISAMKTYEFGQEISIADDLAGDTKVLLFVTGYVNYDFKDSGNELFRGSSVDYQQLVEQLKEIMD